MAVFQGPKLQSAQIDLNGVVEHSGQQLRLFANQTVAHVATSQVTVQPMVPFSVTTTGDVIAVQFDQRLLYSTDYTVTIAGVTSVYEARPATISYRFSTAAPTMYYLHRGQPDDQIVSTGITKAGKSVVYSATHIQSFVVFAKAIAVATIADDGTSELSLVNLSDGAVETLTLPARGQIERMHGASSSSVLGFTFTSAQPSAGTVNLTPQYSSTLFTIDLEAGRKTIPVLGVNGKPVRVVAWLFVPGTSQLIALTRELSALYIDPTRGSIVTPIGQYTDLDHISNDGKVLSVSDQLGSIALTVSDLTEKRLDASPMTGGTPYLGEFQVLTTGDRIEHISLYDSVSGRFSSRLVIDSGASSRALFQTVGDNGSIEGFSVSPNEQYVAIETVPDLAARVPDGYAIEGRSTTVTTVIVDVASGSVVKSMEGFGISW